MKRFFFMLLVMVLIINCTFISVFANAQDAMSISEKDIEKK
ncbi:hypothetical protein [Paramaledivibacter caminithermalis]|nr:hypothetical protein [Paramaledivibacter caminithermalis]